MKLDEKNIKLLLLLVVVIIVALPYFFIIQPFMNRSAALETEIQGLEAEQSRLDDLSMRHDDFLVQMEEMTAARADIINQYPSELPQENHILFIAETEKAVPISLYQATFGTDVAARITSAAEEEAIEAVEAATGDVTNDQVIEDNTQTGQIASNLLSMSTETQFSYAGSYAELKDFLKYILDYQDRMVIKNINISYAAEDDAVGGNLTLAQYAILGVGNVTERPVTPAYRQGSNNIFRQAAGNNSEGVAADSTAPDFFLMLSQPDADVETKIFGRSNDASESSYLVNDDNSEQELSITFEGSGGSYAAHYEIGNQSYDEAGVEFQKNGAINFEIISSPRVGEDDDVTAQLSIINETDTTLNVRVLEDDPEFPRVDIVESTGVILVE